MDGSAMMQLVRERTVGEEGYLPRPSQIKARKAG